ncbi:hypothetical protein I5U22_16135 [Serratia ureilytica]|uniref:retron Ec48 family effector membrane protein n=1 Tax=Serratia TaxID=613 RepID=UPI00147D095D|nr:MULTISPECIES: retron Ec48 family effector membrane protein [Serratia]MBH1902869.1 hypothetical protein [Serratia ureilytica]
MIVFNKVKNDFKAMKKSFFFLYREFCSVISLLFKIIWGIRAFIFKRSVNQDFLMIFKRNCIKLIKRFRCAFIRTVALSVAFFIFIVGTPLLFINVFLINLGKLLDRIPLGDFGRDKEIRGLILTIISVFMLGVIFSVVVSVFTIYSEKLYQRDICFTDSCVIKFFANFNSVSIILQSVAWLITLITTIGGIGIALMTYKTGVKNSNLTNHISHLNMFRDYVNAEISKRKFISPDKVNVYKWYSLIFPYSKKGDVSVSIQYKSKIEDIIKVIVDANEKITSPARKYVYTHHQISMLDAIGLLGVKISTGPKNEFVLIEEQVFELIDCINLTFTEINIELSGVKRAYI